MLEEHVLDSGMSVWVARPDTSEPRPAVMWLHERYGIVQHPKDMAERLSEAGYVGVSPDLFHRFDGDQDALSRGDARVIMRDDESLIDLTETINFLQRQAYVQSDQIGIIGVCQTGRQPLLYAAHRNDIAGVVALYGGADGSGWEPTPARPVPSTDLVTGIDCPVLGLFGEADHSIEVDAVRALRGALEDTGKSYRIRIYRDAPHGWFNDTMPGRYRPEARAAAWDEILIFFQGVFAGEWDNGRVTWDFSSDIAQDYDFSKNVRFE